MRNLFTSFILISVLSLAGLQAQDNVYSQFYFAPSELNPALTGITFNSRLSFIYRNQWPNMPNAYVTYTAAWDQYFEKLNSGFGLTLTNDALGDGIWKNTHVSGLYAYNIEAGKNLFIRAGAKAGFVSSRINWDRLVFLDQLNPMTGAVDGSGAPNPTQQTRPGDLNITYFDASAGLTVYSDKLYGGISFHHLNTPNTSFLSDRYDRGRLPMRMSVQLGGEFVLNPHNKVGTHPFISPNLIFTHQRNFNQINLGAYAGMGALFGGLWYRNAFGNSDAIIGSVGFRKDILRIGYSYDATISGLGNANTGGAHEISLTLNFDTEKSKKKRYAKRYGNCLNIFK